MANETWAARTPRQAALGYVIETLQEHDPFGRRHKVGNLAQRVGVKMESLDDEINEIVIPILEQLYAEFDAEQVERL